MTRRPAVCRFDVGGRVSVQLACYPGEGARYVRHTDASDAVPGRTVTALLYLNPNWDVQVWWSSRCVHARQGTYMCVLHLRCAHSAICWLLPEPSSTGATPTCYRRDACQDPVVMSVGHFIVASNDGSSKLLLPCFIFAERRWPAGALQHTAHLEQQQQ
jgi:hypothetical protein